VIAFPASLIIFSGSRCTHPVLWPGRGGSILDLVQGSSGTWSSRRSHANIGQHEVEKTNKVFWTAAAVLSLTAVAVFHLAPQVPLGIAWDEPTKVQEVLKNTQSFRHPILMLQIVRLANLFVGSSDPVGVLWLGRTAAAVSGGLLVFAAIALSRRAVGDSAALGAGVLTAVAPLTVLHAQLFKEDIFVAPWLVLGVLALDHLRETPAFRQAVLFGVAAGLAAAAKYIGVVLVGLSLLLPVWAKTQTRCYYRMVVVAVIAAAAVFCVVNLPLFVTPRAFIFGLSSGVRHGLSGHDIVLYPWHSLFAFTWNADIWPAMVPTIHLQLVNQGSPGP
jgi:4-amino-4-deoxy-L-arabinose transferase-like glycosyltransferase